MQSQTLADRRTETSRQAQATRRASRTEDRMWLERMALMSDDRSRLNPRRELDILALTTVSAGSNGAEGRL